MNPSEIQPVPTGPRRARGAPLAKAWLRFRRAPYAAAALAGCAALLVAACGEDAEGPSGALTVPRPTQPAARQCSAPGSAERLSEKPPRPGTYVYRARGRRTLVGGNRRAFTLPRTMQVVVSPARRVGRLTCFALQRRFADDLADTGVFLIRGDDIYLRAVRFQSGSYVKAFEPNPAILSLNGSELSWSGVFRGRAAGRYAAELIGRKTIKVGSRKVHAVGIQSRASYAGSVKGWDRSIQWFAPASHLIVAERATRERTIGLDRLRLSYNARLTALAPR